MHIIIICLALGNLQFRSSWALFELVCSVATIAANVAVYRHNLPQLHFSVGCIIWHLRLLNKWLINRMYQPRCMSMKISTCGISCSSQHAKVKLITWLAWVLFFTCVNQTSKFSPSLLPTLSKFKLENLIQALGRAWFGYVPEEA